MNPRFQTVAGWLLVGLVSLCSWGCGGAPGGDLVDASYLLQAAPPDAVGVKQARARVESSSQPLDVVVTGRIDGLGQPTWDPARAAFLLCDLSMELEEEHDGAPSHDASSCPFCRKKEKERAAGLAMIEIVDPEGNVPAVDARDLLKLADGQVLVIRGQGAIDGLGNLVVRSDGVFVKP